MCAGKLGSSVIDPLTRSGGMAPPGVSITKVPGPHYEPVESFCLTCRASPALDLDLNGDYGDRNLSSSKHD